jgi:hypothetical protein
MHGFSTTCSTHIAIRVNLQLVEKPSTQKEVLLQIREGETTQAGDGVPSIGKLCDLQQNIDLLNCHLPGSSWHGSIVGMFLFHFSSALSLW